MKSIIITLYIRTHNNYEIIFAADKYKASVIEKNSFFVWDFARNLTVTHANGMKRQYLYIHIILDILLISHCSTIPHNILVSSSKHYLIRSPN